jgi:hypothetical protein
LARSTRADKKSGLNKEGKWIILAITKRGLTTA